MSGIDKCPPKTDLEKAAEMPDGLDKTMTAMGVESCKTDTSKEEYNYAAQANMDIAGGLLGSASVSASGGGMKTASSSVGCEQISAVAKNSIDVSDKIQCTLKENVLDSSQTAKAYNRIKIKTGGNFTANCDGPFTIDQKNEVKLNSSISFTAEQMKQVEQTIKDGLKQTSEIIKNTETGWGATPEGQKYIEQTQEKIVKGEYDANIQKNMMKITQLAEGENVLEIEVGEDYTIRGKQCVISQSNVLELIADIVYSDSMNNVFKEYYEKVREYDSKTEQTTVSGGAPTLPPATVPPDAEKTGTVIAVALIALALIGGGVYWLTRSGDEDE